MVLLYPPYARPASSPLPIPLKTHPLQATPAISPTLPRATLTSLPDPIIHHILSHLPTSHLHTLSKTSTLLRSVILTYLSSRRQQALAHIRSLQDSVIAANLPNEILQEVLSYLSPLDFYNATRVCSAWRHAASYPRLVRKNVFAAQPTGTVPPEGDLDGELKTLAFYLQASGELPRDLGSRITNYIVSTLYLKQPGEELMHPGIHVSENGHYFLAAERAYPWRIHVYSTYRPVLVDDINSQRGDFQGFHEWDMTPTYLLTLPETGPVLSASFGPAIYGGVEYDKGKGSYSKGLDLLVLFEGAKGRLYKIRETLQKSKPVGNEENTLKTFGKRLLGWVKSEGRFISRGARQKWRIWDSMEFSDVCLSHGGPMIAKLWRSRRVIFATAGHLEVWKDVNDFRPPTALALAGGKGKQKEEEQAMVWNKGAAVRNTYRIPKMPGRISGIFTGFIWHSGLGADVDYIVCSNSPVTPTEEFRERQRRPMIENNSYNTAKTIPNPRGASKVTASTIILTPTESFSFSYTSLVECQNYSGAPLFLGLTPNNTLSQIQLLSTLNNSSLNNWHTDAWGDTSYQPCTFITKSIIDPPSTSSLFKLAHIAAVCIPGHPTHPIIVAAADSGNIYISIPSCYSAPSRPYSTPLTLPNLSEGFEKLARVPPDTGGRITGLKISFRGPVWGSAQRDQLHSDDLRPASDRNGVLVVVVATDRGRVEMCYFDLSAKKELGNLGTKVWDLCSDMVVAR